MDVTVVIPTIPPRRETLLNRCLPSVYGQTCPPNEVIIVSDLYKRGAGPTRTSGMLKVSTEWTAFLDDDDQLLPNHLEVLQRHQEETGADVVWPWYKPALGAGDPIKANRGKQWNPELPHTFPITALVRTSFAQQGEFPAPERPDFSGDDWHFWMQMSRLGAKFSHVDEATWVWWIDGHNTSGAPARW